MFVLWDPLTATVDTNMATSVNFDPSNLHPTNDLIVVCCTSPRFPSCQSGMVPGDNISSLFGHSLQEGLIPRHVGSEVI